MQGTSSATGSNAKILSAITCCLLFLRLGRVLLLSSRLGPYVLMTFRMIGDVFAFVWILAIIVPAFAAAFYKLAEQPDADFDERATHMYLPLEATCTDYFITYHHSITYTLEMSLGGGEFLKYREVVQLRLLERA